MRLQIEFDKELMAHLDKRRTEYGLDRANFVRMLVRAGRVSDTPIEEKKEVKRVFHTQEIVKDVTDGLDEDERVVFGSYAERLQYGKDVFAEHYGFEASSINKQQEDWIKSHLDGIVDGTQELPEV